jgi:hypothetical protein
MKDSCCSNDHRMCSAIHAHDGRKGRSITKEEFGTVVQGYAQLSQRMNAKTLGALVAAARAQYQGQQIVFVHFVLEDDAINTKVVPWRAVPRSEPLLRSANIHWEHITDPTREQLFFLLIRRGDQPEDWSSAAWKLPFAL